MLENRSPSEENVPRRRERFTNVRKRSRCRERPTCGARCSRCVVLTGIRPRVRGRAKLPRVEESTVQGERVVPKALVCGAALRALREQAGIGLEDFARLAKLNRPSVSKLEAGRTMLAVHHLDLYAEVINGHGRGGNTGWLTGARIFGFIEGRCEELRAEGTEVDWRAGVAVVTTGAEGVVRR